MGGKSGKQVPFWDGAPPETPKFVKERTMELRCYQAANAVVIMLSARCYPRGTGSRGKIASHISISARRQDLASLVDERNAIYRHFLPEEPLV